MFYMGKIGSDYWICVGFIFFVLFVRLIIVWKIKECNLKKKFIDDKLIFMIKLSICIWIFYGFFLF